MGFTDLTAFLRKECQKAKLRLKSVTRNIGFPSKDSDLSANLRLLKKSM